MNLFILSSRVVLKKKNIFEGNAWDGSIGGIDGLSEIGKEGNCCEGMRVEKREMCNC